ncbi:MAG: hypothetical protein MJ229_06795, partial [bacterium]|nr:hypothetical protein [bacterium]
MKKALKITIILILLSLTFHGCIKKDTQEKQTNTIEKVFQTPVIFPQKPINVTIDGIDYRQSQTPIGNFGGKLVSSTIGEGPKTFNPFNTKDATSSTMVSIMYDGLVTTDAQTG